MIRFLVIFIYVSSSNPNTIAAPKGPPKRISPMRKALFSACALAQNGIGAYTTKLGRSLTKEYRVISDLSQFKTSFSSVTDFHKLAGELDDHLSTAMTTEKFIKSLRKDVHEGIESFYSSGRSYSSGENIFSSSSSSSSSSAASSATAGFFEATTLAKMKGSMKSLIIESVLNSLGSCLIGHELGYLYKYEGIYKDIKNFRNTTIYQTITETFDKWSTVVDDSSELELRRSISAPCLMGSGSCKEGQEQISKTQFLSNCDSLYF